ncbi:MAG: hypothetical protein FWC27_11970 [Firmicutes bacterium]|nr:hypothetical protein [Bacillota bacterium]
MDWKAWLIELFQNADMKVLLSVVIPALLGGGAAGAASTIAFAKKRAVAKRNSAATTGDNSPAIHADGVTQGNYSPMYNNCSFIQLKDAALYGDALMQVISQDGRLARPFANSRKPAKWSKK